MDDLARGRAKMIDPQEAISVRDQIHALVAERDRLTVRLAHATRILQAVAGSQRNGAGRLELTRELERAVEAFCTQTPWVAYYAKEQTNG